MLNPLMALLPMFLYKKLALKLCGTTTVQGKSYVTAAPDILIKVGGK